MAQDRYRVRKGRTRQSWAAWADRVYERGLEALQAAAQHRPAPENLPTVESAAIPHGDRVPEPVRRRYTVEVSVASGRRRAFAQRMHEHLADLEPGTGAHEPSRSVVQVPVAGHEGLGAALRAAPWVARHDPAAVAVTTSRRSGAVVVRLHGDTFSVVFHASPGGGATLVFLDEVPGYAVRVDTDPAATAYVAQMKAAVLAALDPAPHRAPP